MAEVAVAYVTLLPSARGFGRRLENQIAPDLGRAGNQGGATYGKSFTAAVARSAQDTQGATRALDVAMRQHADATGRVRVAEQKLADVRGRSRVSAGAVASAEEALARAQRTQLALTRRVTGATEQLRVAREAQGTIARQQQGAVARGTTRSGSRLGQLFGGSFGRSSDQSITRGVGNTARNLPRATGRSFTAAGRKSGGNFGSSFGRTAALSMNATTTRGFANNMTSVNGALTGFGSVAAFGASGVTALVSALGGLAAAAGGIGLKVSAALESAEVGFTTLTGSAEMARGMMAELSDFAVQSPFEIEGLVGNARALLGVGVNAQAIIPTLQTLGDVTSAYGLNQEQFNGIMRSFTQIAAKGKVQREELLQMEENGLPASMLFAKGMGISVEALNELTRDSNLTAQEALPQLLKQLKQNYSGAMEAQMQTLSGRWANFREEVKLTLRDAVEPMVPTIKRLLPQASAVFRQFIDGVLTGSSQVKGSESKWAAYGARVREVFIEIQPYVETWLNHMRNLGEAVVEFVRSTIVGLQGFWTNMKTAFGGGAAQTLTFKDALASAGLMISDYLIPALSWLTRNVLPALGTAIGYYLRAVHAMHSAFVGLAVGVHGAMLAVVSAVTTGINAVLEAANRVSFLMGPAMMVLVREASEGFKTFSADTIEGMTGVQEKLEFVRDAIASVRDEAVAVDDVVSAKQWISNRGGAKLPGPEKKKPPPVADPSVALLPPWMPGVDAEAEKKRKRAMQKAVDDAKRALDDARKQMLDYAKSVSDSIKNFGSITSITDVTGAAATPNSLIRFMRNQLTKIKQFQRDLATLARRGLSNSLLRQIADAGVQGGGPVARALVRSTPKQFKELTALDKEIGARADTVGGRVAKSLFGAQVKAAQQQVINVTINNPKPERASESAPKAVRRGLVAAGA